MDNPKIIVPIHANKPKFKLKFIGSPFLPIRPHQIPKNINAGT